MRATECDIELSGEIVTSKVVVNTVNYFYDSEGRLKTKIITPRGGSACVIYYENNDNGTVVKFTAGSNSVTSHSKTDSFGRKTFDELQLGTGFVSRQFSYHAGDITEEHKDNANLKSTATTQLVSQIVLSDGRTLSYEYDAEERIVSVVDSFEGTTAYTYDALGQLLTETVNGKLVNSMEYDNYGNIVKKNGVAYTYGDTVWKDKLTKVGTQSITYDAQGNPTSYLGHTLTWEKGRQLKSYDSNTYTYNANGIRTSKIVNGVKHTYTLEGTKILREVWGTNTLVPLYDNEDSICGILYNGVPYYFLKNLQGDVIAIVNKGAETVAKYSYDAWGVPTIVVDTTECKISEINPYRYRSYYYDTEIAKYYLQSRYYDASVGRFVNGDKPVLVFAIALSQFINLYTYCDNAPIKFSDALGLGPWSSTLSLQDYRTIHNTVADKVVETLGDQARREVYVKGTLDGKTVRGFLDVYDSNSNEYYEVKSLLSAYTTSTEKQMNKYDHSKVWLSQKGNVIRGTKTFSGTFWYGAWEIEYSSSKTVRGLIEYKPTYDNGRRKKMESTVANIVVITIIVVLVCVVIGLVVSGAGLGALAF